MSVITIDRFRWGSEFDIFQNQKLRADVPMKPQSAIRHVVKRDGVTVYVYDFSSRIKSRIKWNQYSRRVLLAGIPPFWIPRAYYSLL